MKKMIKNCTVVMFLLFCITPSCFAIRNYVGDVGSKTRIVITIFDEGTGLLVDKPITIEYYGNAQSAFAFDKGQIIIANGYDFDLEGAIHRFKIRKDGYDEVMITITVHEEPGNPLFANIWMTKTSEDQNTIIGNSTNRHLPDRIIIEASRAILRKE